MNINEKIQKLSERLRDGVPPDDLWEVFGIFSNEELFKIRLVMKSHLSSLVGLSDEELIEEYSRFVKVLTETSGEKPDGDIYSWRYDSIVVAAKVLTYIEERFNLLE